MLVLVVADKGLEDLSDWRGLHDGAYSSLPGFGINVTLKVLGK